ncbi:PIG-L deacetylase family protein [Paenibacillus sp. GCM10027629]|uniref:PIG-L deacetylase family protein n=1 Tax=Paenibacillus sp. GCM10027629 TaxID=3273414 RepID=UPI003631476B
MIQIEGSCSTLLILAPHTDDAELGCGALIAKRIEQGAKVVVAAFSTAEESVPQDMPRDTLVQEFYASMEDLGIPHDRRYVLPFPVRKFPAYRQEILDQLIVLKREVEPDMVLLPSSVDLHQDHQTIYSEGMRAFKEQSVFGYELPWNQLQTENRAFATVSKRHVDLKWKALTNYHSQLKLQRSYFSEEFIYGLARVRGVQIGAEWAEAYEPLRVKL